MGCPAAKTAIRVFTTDLFGMQAKAKKKVTEEANPLSRFVFKMHDGPPPPDRVAAEEKFWKSIVAKVLAAEAQAPDID